MAPPPSFRSHQVRLLAHTGLWLLLGLAVTGLGDRACATPVKEPFPKPEPEKAFSEMKLPNAQGRPWRVAREDWEAARQRVASDPAWEAWLKREKSDVDAWRRKHKDRVAWRAGWSHDFVSPVDGSRVVWTPQIPGEQVDHFHTPSDPRVAFTPKLIESWVNGFRTRHAEMMERAACLYRLTGDKESAEWAAAQLDFYAAHLKEWPPRKDGARLFYQTLTEASSLVVYTQVARLLGDYATPERRARWHLDFFKPEVEIINRTYQEIHNIGCWQRAAAAQVALVFGDEPLWRASIDGPYGLRRQLALGITSDYLWYEQSLGYNTYVVKALNGLFSMAGLYGRAPELAQEIAIAQNLVLSTNYLRFPGGALPCPADSGSGMKAPDPVFLGSVYRIFPSLIGLAEAAGRRDWDTLLDPPGTRPAQRELPAVRSWSLETSRMALLKRGSWQVFFHYGQLTKSHSQEEALNFSAYYGDTDITHDPGTAPYGSALYRGFYRLGPAQNCLLVNGQGQTPPKQGQLLEFDAEQGRMAAAQPEYQPGVRASRALVIEGERLSDTASLETTGDRPQALGLTLHVQGKVEPAAELSADPGFSRGRAAPFAYWRDPRGATFRDHAEFRVRYGKAVFRVSFACKGEFRLWLANTPDSPPKRRDSFYLETHGTRATFVTTFEPVGGD